ncbi:BTB domain-containing protein [Aphelenchoides fujianensis]|nr:BTB domain-containing protein [Aphelenchoides fujianensis]
MENRRMTASTDGTGVGGSRESSADLPKNVQRRNSASETIEGGRSAEAAAGSSSAAAEEGRDFRTSQPANTKAAKIERLASQNEFSDLYVGFTCLADGSPKSKTGGNAINQPQSSTAAAPKSSTSSASGSNGGSVPPASSSSSIADRVAQTLESERLSDVVFIVGTERKPIHAHKYVLSIASEVFTAMFHNPGFQQPLGPEERQKVEIPDIEPSIFRLVLKFLYTDTLQLSSDNVMVVLYAARKYAIQTLENACTAYLKQNLQASNAFLILSQARLFDLTDLADAALELVDHESAEAFLSDCFLEIDQPTLCQVIRRDTLRTSELAIYQACVAWANAQCARAGEEATSETIRRTLGDALHLIRFPLMSLKEFATHVARAPLPLLTDHQMVEIFAFLALNSPVHFASATAAKSNGAEGSPTASSNPFVASVFPAKKRCQMLGRELVVNRFQRVEARWGYSGSPDRIKFTVDLPIFITALGLYGSMHSDQMYEVVIEIVDCATNKTIARNECTVQCGVGMAEPFRVAFREPVEVQPACTYIASALMKGPDSWYGSKGLRRISRQTVNGSSQSVVTFQFSYATGTNNGTSVDDGQIPNLFFCLKMQQ